MPMMAVASLTLSTDAFTWLRNTASATNAVGTTGIPVTAASTIPTGTTGSPGTLGTGGSDT